MPVEPPSARSCSIQQAPGADPRHSSRLRSTRTTDRGRSTMNAMGRSSGVLIEQFLCPPVMTQESLLLRVKPSWASTGGEREAAWRDLTGSERERCAAGRGM